jgi:hypothetical protein
VNFSLFEALQLNRSRLVDPPPNDIRALPRVFAREFLVAQSRNFHLDIDPIEQRTRDFGTVTLNLQRRAGAFFLRIGEKAAHASLRYLSAILGFQLKSQRHLNIRKT